MQIGVSLTARTDPRPRVRVGRYNGGRGERFVHVWLWHLFIYWSGRLA